MSSFLITGASRGFGLALARELVSLPPSTVSKVFATARGDSPALNELAKANPDRVVTLKIDVTSEASIKQAVPEVEANLAGKGLDVLINNAGVCDYVTDGIKSMDTLQESLTINVLGVHWTTRAFLPLLQKGSLKKVANMATSLASITLASASRAVPCPAYKVSKAAMGALTVQYALEYENEGFSFIALCPGWLKTDLGGGDSADLTVEQGAKASLDIIFAPGQKYNGQMPKVLVKGWENKSHRYDGTNLPW
ncbi:NAD(P)-binding protein [Nemania sp. FL0916]|nr:NAD(P)-binding protein [Nemania sp. FL0916]